MNVTIKHRTPEPLLSREKIVAEAVFEGAIPSRKQVSEFIAKKADVEQSLVVISKIGTLFGDKKVDILAYVYANKTALATIEEKKRLKRTGFTEAPAAPATEGAQ